MRIRYDLVGPAILCLALPLQAVSADLTLEVKTAGGAPVRDAVVAVYPDRGDLPAAATRLSGPFSMSQQNIQFHPFVLVVPVGATVSFPNLDKVRHHVYSFSAAKRFDLRLYGQEEHRVVTFDKPGVVAVGCNIHDRMAAFIYVADSPYVGRTDEHGRLTLGDLPDGGASVRLWHPYLKAANQTVSHTMALRAGARDSFTLDLRPAPPAMGAGMGG